MNGALANWLLGSRLRSVAPLPDISPAVRISDAPNSPAMVAPGALPEPAAPVPGIGLRILRAASEAPEAAGVVDSGPGLIAGAGSVFGRMRSLASQAPEAGGKFIPPPPASPTAGLAPSMPGRGTVSSLDPAHRLPDASPLFSGDEMEGMHAATTKQPTRAIRMPNGQILFTNDPSYGGEEISVGDAGKIVRSADAGAVSRGSLRPSSETMSGLLQASTRASAARGPESPMVGGGRMVAGRAPDTSGGAVSMIEGTPEQQLNEKLQDAMGALSLADVGQRRKLAEMDPGARALLENKDVQTASFVNHMLQPRRDQAHQLATQRAQAAAAQFANDPKQLAATLRQIQDERDQSLREIDSQQAMSMGLRPPSI